MINFMSSLTRSQSARMKRKRKRLALQEEEADDETPSRPQAGGKSVVGGKGIHRLNPHKNDFDYGADYRSKVNFVITILTVLCTHTYT